MNQMIGTSQSSGRRTIAASIDARSVAKWIVLIAAVVIGSTAAIGIAAEPPLPGYASTRPLRDDASLQAIAFASPSVGIAVGDRGTIVRTADAGNQWTLVESGVETNLTDVVWLDAQRVIAVGGRYDRITGLSRGVVLHSDNAGLRWTRALDQELPRLTQVQLRQDGSVVVSGDWSDAGLTRQFESHDGGRNWVGSIPLPESSPRPTATTSSDLLRWTEATGVAAPIRDATLVGDSRLYAVGDHGVILRSDDNGQSWTVQRAAQRQTAILMVADTAASVPWALLGSEALESRNRVSLLIDRGDDAAAMALADQVAVMLGGAGADAIGGVDPSGRSAAIATGQADRTAAAAQWIAVHRPAVLVLDRQLDPALRDAFFQAATAAAVARIAVCDWGTGHSTVLHRDALLPRTGMLASDLAADALHWVAPQQSAPESISLHYLYDVADARRRGDSCTSGLNLAPGRQLSATLAAAPRRQLQIVQARMNHRQRVQRLIDGPPSQFAPGLTALLDQTAKEDQFRLAWSTLQQTRHHHHASLEHYRVVLTEISKRFPTSSAALWAQMRREAIAHSEEWQRLRSAAALLTSDQPAVIPAAETVAVSPFQVAPSGVRQASSVAPLVVPKPETVQIGTTPDTSTAPAEVDLAWELHPLTLIARDAARRRGDHGALQVADGGSANLRRLAQTPDHPWSRLVREGGPAVIPARRAAAPPRLDADFSDPCWQSALPSAGQTTRLRVAYDDGYVYLALECPADRIAVDSAADSATATSRDHDLRNVDRLRLSIDVDQDLITAMQLQLTDAGRTQDAIDGDAAWQPTWYVATQRNAQQVRFEIAMVRRDLVELPIHAGQSWYLSAVTLKAASEGRSSVIPNPNDWVRVVFGP